MQPRCRLFSVCGLVRGTVLLWPTYFTRGQPSLFWCLVRCVVLPSTGPPTSHVGSLLCSGVWSGAWYCPPLAHLPHTWAAFSVFVFGQVRGTALLWPTYFTRGQPSLCCFWSQANPPPRKFGSSRWPCGPSNPCGGPVEALWRLSCLLPPSFFFVFVALAKNCQKHKNRPRRCAAGGVFRGF